MKIGHIIKKKLDGNSLTEKESFLLCDSIMKNKIDDILKAGILMALKIKKETIEEVKGFALAMRKNANKIKIRGDVIDTCGTGGDGKRTFNISTAAAICAAAGGLKVAKHGNRSVSSQTGSADVLEKLGINIMQDINHTKESINKINIGFLFAPLYHPAMKNVANVRKTLGTRTIFNMLGPICNPANANIQLIGVFNKQAGKLLAEVLRELKIKRAMIVISDDGLDEISVFQPTNVFELYKGKIKKYKLFPEKIIKEDFKRTSLEVKNAIHSAKIIRDIFLNKIKDSRYHEVIINAGAIFYMAKNLKNLREGYLLAKKIIDEKLAWNKLNEFISFNK